MTSLLNLLPTSGTPSESAVSALLQCRGLTEALPHLARCLSWLHANVDDSWRDVLLKANLPSILCGDIIERLDSLNRMCFSASLEDEESLFFSPKLGKPHFAVFNLLAMRWREWNRLTSGFTKESLQNEAYLASD